MKIGIAKEIKADEYRVAMTPSGVQELIKQGNEVYVETHAGEGSGFDDNSYVAIGATIVATAKEAYACDMMLKVKEPIASEYKYFREGLILFTYLHLAADRALTEALLEAKVEAYAYETLSVNGRLPLLEPMSEVAGKMASLFGATHLGRYGGGSGRLLGGVVGVENNTVLILGAGVAGKAAAEAAAGLGADVTMLDINLERLHYLSDVMPDNVTLRYSDAQTIESLVSVADLIIGTVLLPGAKAPKLIRQEHLKMMKKGTVLVDVSIDQGGCFETSHPTTHHEPTFEVEGIVHYCVANMPGAYPRTSTMALTHATMPYIITLARAEKPLSNPILQSALNTINGRLTNAFVAKAHRMDYGTDNA
ncbi:MAG: alanine dehydrogenase [Campylobacterota bacterium]|nr:alanine dehydrogenase [Campylobacterota bacterium]